MQLDIHGLVIACETPSPELGAALVRPYRYFLSEGGRPLVTIRAQQSEPPYGSFPGLVAQFSTPRNVVYQHGRLKIVDYFGRGAVVHDADRATYSIYSEDANLLQEAFYLLVLSLLGQHCDRVGRLRVHALALSSGDRAFLFMMPPGSGKSTLALGMLQHSGAGYISDDDPLFDRRSGILPFPRALGILDRASLVEIPDRFVYRVDRMEFGAKYFVDAEYWTNRIERRALQQIVLVTTRRVLNGEPAVEPIARREVLRTLLRDAVLGIGLYQGLEFLVQRSSTELLAKVPLLLRRTLLAVRLAHRSRAFRLVANRDRDAVRRVVQTFVERAPGVR